MRMRPPTVEDREEVHFIRDGGKLTCDVPLRVRRDDWRETTAAL